MPPVRGIGLEPQTRCAHYHTALDVIAIRMKCCGEYFACRECHDALADHPAKCWPVDERDRLAVCCGVCESEMTIAAYLSSGDRCPACGAAFNPGCRNHYPLYFES